MDDAAWKRQGPCSTDPEPDALWFATHARAQHDAASICKRACPVQEQCLIWALERREWHGVWGGTTEHERRMMLTRNPGANWHQRVTEAFSEGQRAS